MNYEGLMVYVICPQFNMERSPHGQQEVSIKCWHIRCAGRARHLDGPYYSILADNAYWDRICRANPQIVNYNRNNRGDVIELIAHETDMFETEKDAVIACAKRGTKGRSDVNPSLADIA